MTDIILPEFEEIIALENPKEIEKIYMESVKRFNKYTESLPEEDRDEYKKNLIKLLALAQNLGMAQGLEMAISHSKDTDGD